MSFENWIDSDISYESDYEAYDTENEEGYEISDSESIEDYAEAKRRRRRDARGVGGRPMGRVRPQPYQGHGTVNTPAGKAEVKLPPNLVTKAEFQELEKKVLSNNKAILVNGKAINTLNSTTKGLENAIAKQGKALAETNKRLGDMQQMSMLTALIPPKLTGITLETVPVAGSNTVVKNSNVDQTTMLIPLLMGGMMGGSGTGSGNNSMNMMLPLILLTQNNQNNQSGNAGSSGTNNSLMLAMVMMMGMGGNK